MTDDKSQTGNPDRQRINLSEDYEVRDWSQKIGVSEDRLRAAGGKVGHMADDVERELRGSMRPATILIVAAAAVSISVAVYFATGGHFVFFALPLLFVLPMLGRRRR